MKRIVFVSVLIAASIGRIYAENDKFPQDTIKIHYLDEVVVSSSTKETNDPKSFPTSISIITPQMIEGQRITSIKGLSAVIPNFFVADYGSKFSTPVYIRGIGERSTGQSIGMYVDNMPYMDKSVFDFDFMDIQRMEILRGPQGTLYGRNAMSGIVNIFTWSPLDYERTKMTLTAGNYGLFRFNASVSKKVSERTGISLSGYNNGNNGFFKNQYNGKCADRLRSAGGRFRLDRRFAEKWTLQLMANYDDSEQGAFPYGEYVNGKIALPDYDHPGRYTRKVAGSNVNLEYKNDRIIFSSSTGFQYFDDDMHMDLDYAPRPVFIINQLQTERNWTQEFAVKSNTTNNYRWSFGAFGFSRDLCTDVVTTMQQGAVSDILQAVFDRIMETNPNAPKFEITDSEIPIPGRFKTPAYGGAIFHQSTYNNLFIKDLSLTAGIRLDYEKTKLDYNTSMMMNLNVTPPGMPMPMPIKRTVETKPIGSGDVSFTEWLPKVALKYVFDEKRYMYVSAAKGHKAGGYNIQMFADIVRNIIEEKGKMMNPPVEPLPQELPESILPSVLYQPEYSWNYEAGYKGEVVKNFLYTELAFFYIDVRDIQITDFVESGQGRILKNAGKAQSLGFDLGLTVRFNELLRANVNYGFTRATFKNYETGEKNFKGKIIPFAPQNTLSLSMVYNKRLTNKFIDRFNIQAQYNAAGKIYWTEANDVYQKFYGILNTKAAVDKGIFELSIWTNNTLNTDYAAFYFESLNRSLAQRGRPFTMGVDVSIRF